ncbi:MAG TPA: SDR family NAD(P)-dependent oxidoreductase, partial [Deltaproteobacteria bacterium]|nr:SDR family NAD(P)-dependent oxidoreductase [Deltaproteobacteria bacterium]
MTAESDGGVVLVTGASSGFGRETAALLAERGWRVYGTSRKPAACGETRFELLELDVASERSVTD